MRQNRGTKEGLDQNTCLFSHNIIIVQLPLTVKIEITINSLAYLRQISISLLFQIRWQIKPIVFIVAQFAL